MGGWVGGCVCKETPHTLTKGGDLHYIARKACSTSTSYNVVLIQVRLGVHGQWAVSPIWAVIIIF